MRSSRIKWVSSVAGLAMLGLLLVAGCHAHKQHDIEYWVKGTASLVSVTYSNDDDAIARAINRELPWYYSFRCDETPRYLYISAQNEGDSGSVEVHIYVDARRRLSDYATDSSSVATAEMMWPNVWDAADMMWP